MDKLFSRQWWFNRPKKWFAYLVLFAAGWLGFLFFRVLNWTRVEGRQRFRQLRRRQNGKERRNVIIVSNHLTMFDSFIVGIIAYFPEVIFWPSVAPYHFAAQENYFKNWLARLLFNCLKALPVKPSRKDLSVMNRVLEYLPRANVHIFPGGRRQYEPLKEVRAGIGYILCNAPEPAPLVVPVYLGGVEKIFGGRPGDKSVARWLPRLTGVLRRPVVRFGEPIKWQDIVSRLGNTKAAWQEIARRVADSINRLDPNFTTQSQVP